MKPEALQLNELKDLPQVKIDTSDKVLENKKLEPLQNKEIAEETKLDPKKLLNKEKLLGASKELDPEKIEDFVEALNKFLLAFDQKFKFRIHKETNRIWLRILDAETDKVLREVPTSDALKLAAKIKEFVGLFVDERA